ncbi:hypothetical protein BDZ89DRAFT_1066522 [Hymenopellis radicata]|nr:hypothetical protein BDZ89DRAFT_1066522 [Hymenopellis radicata]
MPILGDGMESYQSSLRQTSNDSHRSSFDNHVHAQILCQPPVRCDRIDWRRHRGGSQEDRLKLVDACNGSNHYDVGHSCAFSDSQGSEEYFCSSPLKGY